MLRPDVSVDKVSIELDGTEVDSARSPLPDPESTDVVPKMFENSEVAAWSGWDDEKELTVLTEMDGSKPLVLYSRDIDVLAGAAVALSELDCVEARLGPAADEDCAVLKRLVATMLDSCLVEVAEAILMLSMLDSVASLEDVASGGSEDRLTSLLYD